MSDEHDYILAAAAALDGSTYDAEAIEILKGLEPHRRKPWEGLMYDPTDPQQVARLRWMMEDYMRKHPDEDLSDQIAKLTVPYTSIGER